MGMPAPYFLFLLGREFLRLSTISQSCKARACLLSLSPAKPGQVLRADDLSILGRAIKEWASWTVSCRAGETRSPLKLSFSLLKTSQAEGGFIGTEQCRLVGG